MVDLIEEEDHITHALHQDPQDTLQEVLGHLEAHQGTTGEGIKFGDEMKPGIDIDEQIEGGLVRGRRLIALVLDQDLVI